MNIDILALLDLIVDLYTLFQSFMDSFSSLQLAEGKKIIYAGQPGSYFSDSYKGYEPPYFDTFPYRFPVNIKIHTAAWLGIYAWLFFVSHLHDKKKTQLVINDNITVTPAVQSNGSVGVQFTVGEKHVVNTSSHIGVDYFQRPPRFSVVALEGNFPTTPLKQNYLSFCYDFANTGRTSDLPVFPYYTEAGEVPVPLPLSAPESLVEDIINILP